MTDSLSAIYSLQKLPPNDSICLITTVLSQTPAIFVTRETCPFYVDSKPHGHQTERSSRLVSGLQPSLSYIRLFFIVFCLIKPLPRSRPYVISFFVLFWRILDHSNTRDTLYKTPMTPTLKPVQEFDSRAVEGLFSP